MRLRGLARFRPLLYLAAGNGSVDLSVSMLVDT